MSTNNIDDCSCYKLVILYKDINNSAHVLRARELVGSISCRLHLVRFTLCRSNDADKETINNDLLSYLQFLHKT